MNFQYGQLLLLIPAILFFLTIWKIKSIKLKIAILIVLSLLAIFNPLRFKQQGGEALERFKSSDQELPARVNVKKEEFSQKQKKEMQQLKKESKEIQREEIN